MTSKSPKLNNAPPSSANTEDSTPNSISTANTNDVRNQVASLDQDLARLTAVLSGASLTTSSDAELEELNESSVAALLKQLEGADGVLNGVEDKLEGLLGNLDTLLAALEKGGGEAEGGEIDGKEVKEEEKEEENGSERQEKNKDAPRED